MGRARGPTFAFRGEPFTFHGVPAWMPEAEVNTFPQRTRSPSRWWRSYEPLGGPSLPGPGTLAHSPAQRSGKTPAPAMRHAPHTHHFDDAPRSLHFPIDLRLSDFRKSGGASPINGHVKSRTRRRRNGRTAHAFTCALHSGTPSIPRRRPPDHAHRGAPRARRTRQATAGAQPAPRPPWSAPGPPRGPASRPGGASPRSSPPPPRRTPRAWAARSRPPPPRWLPCAAPPPPPRGPRPAGPARRGAGPAARARARPRRRG